MHITILPSIVSSSQTSFLAQDVIACSISAYRPHVPCSNTCSVPYLKALPRMRLKTKGITLHITITDLTLLVGKETKTSLPKQSWPYTDSNCSFFKPIPNFSASFKTACSLNQRFHYLCLNTRARVCTVGLRNPTSP